MKISKKIFIFASLVLSLSLVGCSGGDDNKKEEKVTEKKDKTENKDNKDKKEEKKDDKDNSKEISTEKKDDLIKKAHTIIKAVDKRDYKAAAELSNGDLENYFLNNSSDLENKVLNRLGKMEKIGESKMERVEQNGIKYIAVYTNVKYENSDAVVETVFDEQMRLAGIYYR